MVETRWENLRDKRVVYLDGQWRLTGDVDVRNSGELLAIAAIRDNDVKGERATFYFGADDGPKSLNPGNLGVHFDRLERDGDGQYLLVKGAGRTYRYELQRLSYE